MSSTILFALGCGVLGVIYAVMTAMWVSKQDAGNEKMQGISNAVKEGAMAFLAREYKTVAMVAVPLTVLLSFLGGNVQQGHHVSTLAEAAPDPRQTHRRRVDHPPAACRSRLPGPQVCVTGQHGVPSEQGYRDVPDQNGGRPAALPHMSQPP